MEPEFLCPSCGEEGKHTILKEGKDLLVQCTLCGHIHHILPEKEPEPIVVKTIVSLERDSTIGTIELFEDEVVNVGDLLVAEVGDEAIGVEVTGIEMGFKRRRRATANAISTLWTRGVENVVVRVSVHDREKTTALYVPCDGEEDFVIGDVYQADRMRYRVVQIKLRDGAVMRKDGWKAYARKIKRVYANRC